MSSPKTQAKNFLRPLQWMNKILDVLIAILESQHKFSAPVSLGTRRLLHYLVELKHRAIKESLDEEWFQEQVEFIHFYKILEELDETLDEAILFADHEYACQVKLNMAKLKKRRLLHLFPKYRGIWFFRWYAHFYKIDKLIDRLLDQVTASGTGMSQDDLKRALKQLADAIKELWDMIFLNEELEESFGIPEVDALRRLIDNLLDRVRKGNLRVLNRNDRITIRKVLVKIRSNKHKLIDRLGKHGDHSILRWYRMLFVIDYSIDNASDNWWGGKQSGWDEDRAKRLIRKAMRFKWLFVSLFPLFLNQDLAWWYKKLYQLDVQLKLARELIKAGKIKEAIEALKKARKHKHDLEEQLEKAIKLMG